MAKSLRREGAGRQRQHPPGHHGVNTDPPRPMARLCVSPSLKKPGRPNFPWQPEQAQKSEAASVQPCPRPPAPGICHVLITGMPRKLMDNAMVEAMLQQAGLE